MSKQQDKKIAIIGAGNIGLAIAEGLIRSENFQAPQITLTRRKVAPLELSLIHISEPTRPY